MTFINCCCAEHAVEATGRFRPDGRLPWWFLAKMIRCYASRLVEPDLRSDTLAQMRRDYALDRLARLVRRGR